MNMSLSTAVGMMMAILPGGAFAQEPLKAADGAVVARVGRGARVWSDRNYTLNAWPDGLREHRVFLQASIETDALVRHQGRPREQKP